MSVLRLRTCVLMVSTALCVGHVTGLLHQSARLTPRMEARRDSLNIERGRNDLLETQLAAKVEKLDTVEIPKWRIVRDSAQAILTDTAKYGLAIRALDVADATINSCRRTLGDCTALVDSLNREREKAGRQLADALRITRPALSSSLYGATDLKGGLYLGGELRIRLFGLEAFGRLEQRIDSTAASVRVGAVIPF